MYKVYRNLNNGKLSIQYKGLVVGHADELTMLNVVFKVNQKGRERVIKEKKKNVHAFVIGNISSAIGFTPYKGRDITLDNKKNEYKSGRECIRGIVKYNPFKYHSFMLESFTLMPIYVADKLEIDNTGKMVAYNTY